MLGLIPSDPKITTKRASNGVLTEVCVDADTERVMQRQRVFAMMGSPLLVYAAVRMKGPLWLKAMIASMGAACFVAHYTAFKAVRPHLKKQSGE